MKKSPYTDNQILSILKQNELGTSVPELCREHCMTNSISYEWQVEYRGIEASLMQRMKESEDENRRPKKMYVEEKLKSEIAREAIVKKGREAISTQRDGAIILICMLN